MPEKYNIKIDQDTEEAFYSLKLWCKVNRVPMGRVLNAAIRAMQGLPNYSQVGIPRRCTMTIQYPRQVSIENILRYRKQRNLTRVK
jgi:hypothetical protein